MLGLIYKTTAGQIFFFPRTDDNYTSINSMYFSYTADLCFDIDHVGKYSMA